MNKQDINDSTPVVMLTLGELKAELKAEFREALRTDTKSTSVRSTATETYDCTDGGKYMFGIKSVCKLFGVSSVTAQRYINTFLAPAVKRNGRSLYIDREMAMEIFENQCK